MNKVRPFGVTLVHYIESCCTSRISQLQTMYVSVIGAFVSGGFLVA